MFSISRPIQALPVLAGATAAAILSMAMPAAAAPLDHAAFKSEIVDTPMTARRFGMNIGMVFAGNSTVSMSSPMGDFSGTWEYGSGNQVCTDFAEGPREGVNCLTIEKRGDGRYRTSDGLKLKVAK